MVRAYFDACLVLSVPCTVHMKIESCQLSYHIVCTVGYLDSISTAFTVVVELLLLCLFVYQMVEERV